MSTATNGCRACALAALFGDPACEFHIGKNAHRAGMPAPELLQAVRGNRSSGHNGSWHWKPPAKKRGRPRKVKAA